MNKGDTDSDCSSMLGVSRGLSSLCQTDVAAGHGSDVWSETPAATGCEFAQGLVAVVSDDARMPVYWRSIVAEHAVARRLSCFASSAACSAFSAVTVEAVAFDLFACDVSDAVCQTDLVLYDDACYQTMSLEDCSTDDFQKAPAGAGVLDICGLARPNAFADDLVDEHVLDVCGPASSSRPPATIEDLIRLRLP